MKLCFRPFGVGVEDVDTKVIGGHLSKGLSRAKELVHQAWVKSKPVALTSAEVATRILANGLTAASNAVADVHDALARRIQ